MFFDWSTDKSLVQRRSTSCTAHYCKKTITLSTQYSHWTSYWFRDVLLHVLHTTARRQSRSVLGTHIEQVIGSQTFYFTYCTLLQEDNHAQYSVLTLNKPSRRMFIRTDISLQIYTPTHAYAYAWLKTHYDRGRQTFYDRGPDGPPTSLPWAGLV